MLGISSFFAGSFQKAFEVEKKLDDTQVQFVTSEIIRDKLMDLETVVEDSPDYIIARNQISDKKMPFSYIAKENINGADRLVTKDFFVFNGIYGSTSSSQFSPTLKNPAGITYANPNYFVVTPLENQVYICRDFNTCTDYGLTLGDLGGRLGSLDTPIDITTNGSGTFFISDAGNGRIIQISGTTVSEITTGLNFPTGLAYYKNGTDEYLFVSDTYNGLVKRIDLSDNSIITVAGEGENPACKEGSTAKFCKLNFPTGLHLDQKNNELYIVDSGNDRILKMSDPSPNANKVMDYAFEFTVNKSYKLDKIKIEGGISGGSYDTGASSFIGDAGDYNNINKTFTSATNSHPGKVYYQGNCDIGGNYFYLENSLNISNGDVLMINNSPYTVTNYQANARNCSTEPFITDLHDQVFVTSATGISSNNAVYFSNPTGDSVFKLNNMQFTNNGFQEIIAKLFEVGDSLEKEKHSFGIRIGDGVLGTPEDEIEILPFGGLDFPTGISLSGPETARVIHFADSLNKKIKTSSGGSTPFDYFSPDEIDKFDYLSHFELENDAGVDGLLFSKTNANKILELKLNAKIDDENYKQYIFNAKID